MSQATTERRIDLLMTLIKSVVCDAPLDGASLAALSEEDVLWLYQMSKKHEVAHLVAAALKQANALPKTPIGEKLNKELLLAVYGDSWRRNAFDQICQTLDTAQIDYLPLKGSVLRDYYPESWMRTSADVDMLVHPADFDKACVAFEEAGLRLGVSDGHHIQIFTQEGVTLELHNYLYGEKNTSKTGQFLNEIWSYTAAHETATHRFELDDSMFYFYHLAHAAKHISSGGIGVRPFLDLWILNHVVKGNPVERRAAVERGGLAVFASVAEQLSEVWFGTAEHTDLSKQLEAYILGSGAYGNLANYVAVRSKDRATKKEYFVGRIWKPYDQLKEWYPSLDGKPLLTPLYQMARWKKIITTGVFRRGMKEYKQRMRISDDECKDTMSFLDKLELEY